MSTLVLALGLVFVIEGLVFALAPSRLQDVVELMAKIPPERRRIIGLCAVAFGVALVGIGRVIGG